MSKQSEARMRQEYRDKAPSCGDCDHYRSEITEHPAESSWGRPYTTEKNRRCDIGGFAVKKLGFCRIHKAKD